MAFSFLFVRDFNLHWFYFCIWSLMNPIEEFTSFSVVGNLTKVEGQNVLLNSWNPGCNYFNISLYFVHYNPVGEILLLLAISFTFHYVYFKLFRRFQYPSFNFGRFDLPLTFWQCLLAQRHEDSNVISSVFRLWYKCRRAIEASHASVTCWHSWVNVSNPVRFELWSSLKVARNSGK